MKKQWKRPQAMVEQFMPDEYIAACGDSGTTYKFVCDGGGGTLGDLFDGSGENLYLGGKKAFYSCNKTHVAETDGDFFPGTFYFNLGNDNIEDCKNIPVVIWEEKNSNGTHMDYHATTHLDIDKWETNHS